MPRREWVATLGSLLAFASACRQPDAPRAPAKVSERPSPQAASSTPESTPPGESIRSALEACVLTPRLVVQPGCALGATTPAAPGACADLAPAGSPGVDVLTVLVAHGQYDFARALRIPSMQTALDAGMPGAAEIAKMYRAFEGPRFEPLADGRQVKLEARGLMLGGVVRWGTLSSPRAAFSTVLVQQIPLHDAPLAEADRAAVEGWNLAAMLACLDGRFWPVSPRP